MFQIQSRSLCSIFYCTIILSNIVIGITRGSSIRALNWLILNNWRLRFHRTHPAKIHLSSPLPPPPPPPLSHSHSLSGSVFAFADDTQIYLSVPFSKLTGGLAQIGYDVNVISEYAATNGLSLNLSKSKILILGSNTYVNRIK